MGKVKDLPCINCSVIEMCKRFFTKRLDEYDNERDGCEDYNSESLNILGRKCSVFNEYLFLDHVAFPSRNYHFFWWSDMENKISESAWVSRWNQTRDFWEDLDLFEPRSM